MLLKNLQSSKSQNIKDRIVKKSQKILLVLGIAVTGLIFCILFLSQKPDISEPLGIASFKEVVGPAGNTYADPEYYRQLESLPFKELPPPVAEKFKRIVPAYTDLHIRKNDSNGNVSWSLKAMIGEKDQFTFFFLHNGKITQIGSYIDDVIENAGLVFEAGNIYEILIDQIPKPVLDKLRFFGFEKKPSRAYSVAAKGGPRVFVQLDDTKDGLILSFTKKGEIRSAGRTRSMLTPYRPPKIETMEEIKENLSKYGDRFHVSNVLKKIRNVGVDENEDFRFVVFGDTRSNLKIWNALLQSINKWEPLFAVNVGDFTRYGYSMNMDGYFLQALDQFARFPFLPVVGNHDVRRGGLSYEYTFGGKNSRTYHFDVGNCRFVVLDNSGVESAIPWEEQLKMADKWLEVKSRYKFVFLHKPPYEVEKWAYHSMTEEVWAYPCLQHGHL